MSVGANKRISLTSISIVICTWNRAGLLRETLESLQLQQGCDPGEVEVLVVDNNSSDDTKATVEAFAPGWKLGQLVYLFEPRQGKQFALNQGIARAEGHCIAFTDDDILFEPDWVQNIRTLFAQNDVSLAGGRTFIEWPKGGPPVWYSESMSAVMACVDLGDKLLLPAPENYAPAGNNMVVRRDLFERVGLFSEAHFRHMDHEFGVRSQRARERVGYVPSLAVRAPVDEAILTKQYFRRWAFKAGIARDETNAGDPGPQKPPLWVYRQAVEDGLLGIVLAPFRSPRAAFEREFRFWRHWGAISVYWHQLLFASSHAAWIEKHSQKKKNRTF